MAKQKVKSGRKSSGPGFEIVDRQEKSAVPPRLREKYKNEVVTALMKEFEFGNVMQVPRLKKITINMGLGAAAANASIIPTAVTELSRLAGQKAVVTRARKAISNFKLREGMPIGTMVTLRRERMWEFLDRLVAIAMPRMRDFKGVSPKAFDGRGNYSLGLKEQTNFPEIDYNAVDLVKGMNITIVTTAKNDEEGKALLKHLGMPFKK